MTRSLTESIRDNLNELHEAGTISGYDPLLHGPDNDEDEDFDKSVEIASVEINVSDYDGEATGSVNFQLTGEIDENFYFDESDMREEAAFALQELGIQHYGEVEMEHLEPGDSYIQVWMSKAASDEIIHKFGNKKKPLDGGNWEISIKVR